MKGETTRTQIVETAMYVATESPRKERSKPKVGFFVSQLSAVHMT